jgi:hypothetical protein
VFAPSLSRRASCRLHSTDDIATTVTLAEKAFINAR